MRKSGMTSMIRGVAQAQGKPTNVNRAINIINFYLILLKNYHMLTTGMPSFSLPVELL